MIHLTYRGVIAAAQKAYDEGRLSIQKKSNIGIRCSYRCEDGTCCVIGASLSDADAKRFDERGTGIAGLRSASEIEFPDFDEYYQTQKLQEIYDAVMNKRCRASSQKLAAAFFKQIDRPVPEHLQSKG